MHRKVIVLFIIFCQPIYSLFGQVNEDRLKASMMYYIAEYITWPHTVASPDFTIGIYGENPALLDELSLIAKTRKVKGKPIIIISYSKLPEVVSNLDILFVCHAENQNISTVFNLIKGSSVLLFTDNLENDIYSMINFKTVHNKIEFEVNKQNLILSHFDYKDDLLLYGGTEIDIKELYRSTQKLLEKESAMVSDLEKENKLMEEVISERNVSISELENKIRLANDSLQMYDDTIKSQKSLIAEGNVKLEKKENEYNFLTRQNERLTRKMDILGENIQSQTNHLNNLDKAIAQREAIIKDQTNTINQKNIRIAQERKMVYMFMLLCLALFIIGVMAINAYIRRRKYNFRLKQDVEERTRQLRTANEELSQEIEERKRITVDLIHSERNYREIFNATNEAIFIHDASDGKVIDVNDTMLRMFNYSRSEISTLNFNDICSGIHPYTETEAMKRIKEAVNSGQSTFEWHCRKKSGSLFWAEISLSQSRIGGNDRVLAVVRDIDEKRKIEIELDSYRKNLELMVKLRTEELESVNEELTSTIEELNNSNLHLEVQRKELEATLGDLRTTQAHLIQSEKMASLGIFTAGIAHEINNPINFISSGTSALFNTIENIKSIIGNNDENFKELFEELEITSKAILLGIERTTAIISMLRNYTRTSEQQFISYNCVECINDALMLLHNSLKYRIDVVKEIPETLQIDCLPGRIIQLFVNLITNAIDAIEKEHGSIHIKATQDGYDGVLFEIIDDGKGMDEETLNRVFDPFYTTKSAGRGTGLGLYIVHGIIAEHSGTIKLISKPGAGTNAKIYLPRKQSTRKA